MANKYLIFKTDEFGETPLLFEQLVGHDDIARMVKAKYPDAVIVSAGFWCIDRAEKYSTYGESVSINIKSRLEDVFILNKCFNNGS